MSIAFNHILKLQSIALCMSGLVRSEGLCQAFNDNNRTIKLMFRNPFEDNSSAHHIVIGEQYWTVDYDFSTNSLKLRDNEGRHAPAFASHDLIGATCLTFDSSGCHTLLFYRNTSMTVRRIVTNTNDSDLLAMNLTDTKSFDLNGFPQEIKPDVVFWFKDRLVDMLAINGNNISFNRFAVNYTNSSDTYSVNSTKVKSQPQWDHLIQFSGDHPNHRVMALSTQTLLNRSSRGLLVLLRHNNSIYWCLIRPNKNVKS